MHCRYCKKEICLNERTNKWETDDEMLSHCVREGEIKEAYLHVPPPNPDQAKAEVEAIKKAPPVQPWIFPWAATHRPSV